MYKKQNIFFLGTTTCMYVFKNMKINGNKKKLKSKMKDEKFVCITFSGKRSLWSRFPSSRNHIRVVPLHIVSI